MRWPTCCAITWSIETPGPDVGGALLEPDAGQERAVAARMIAGAVRAAVGRLVVQPAQDLDQLLDRLQRLERAAQLEIRPLLLRPPGRRDGAVGEVDKGRAQRRARRASRPGLPAAGSAASSRRRRQRGERRQRDAGAQPAQEMAAAQARAAAGDVRIVFARSWSS